jgi:hypothetical protein
MLFSTQPKVWIGLRLANPPNVAPESKTAWSEAWHHAVRRTRFSATETGPLPHGGLSRPPPFAVCPKTRLICPWPGATFPGPRPHGSHAPRKDRGPRRENEGCWLPGPACSWRAALQRSEREGCDEWREARLGKLNFETATLKISDGLVGDSFSTGPDLSLVPRSARSFQSHQPM